MRSSSHAPKDRFNNKAAIYDALGLSQEGGVGWGGGVSRGHGSEMEREMMRIKMASRLNSAGFRVPGGWVGV